MHGKTKNEKQISTKAVRYIPKQKEFRTLKCDISLRVELQN